MELRCINEIRDIGISNGNGHPYSWSAIFNGYDKTKMEKCGFASIPRYLEKHDMKKQIKGARISHIWTQEARRLNISLTQHL